jgi:hypothetical protein
MNPPKKPAHEDALPWWRYPMVWLVIGGPAAVVVASLVTAVLAVHGADRPLLGGANGEAQSHTPAAQARNHAATARP